VGPRGGGGQGDPARGGAAHGTAGGAETIEIEASHSIALSQPRAVADLIRTAANATATVAAGG
jgi:hypothetical protein